MAIKEFIKRIDRCLGDEKKILQFRESFKEYNMSSTAKIDDFAADLFEIFLGGSRDHAVAHLDIDKYDEKKEIIMMMKD